VWRRDLQHIRILHALDRMDLTRLVPPLMAFSNLGDRQVVEIRAFGEQQPALEEVAGLVLVVVELE